MIVLVIINGNQNPVKTNFDSLFDSNLRINETLWYQSTHKTSPFLKHNIEWYSLTSANDFVSAKSLIAVYR